MYQQGKYHPILQSQVTEFIGSKKIPAEFEKLLEAVSTSYTTCEEKRVKLESSIDKGLDEMIDLNIMFRHESIRLRAAQEELNALLDNLEDVYFMYDCQANSLIEVSSACKKVFGFSPEQLKEDISLWWNSVHPEDIQIIKNSFIELLDGKTRLYHYRIIWPEKKTRWIEVKVMPKLNFKGELIRIDGILADITEKKKNELTILAGEKLLLESQRLGKMGNWNLDFRNNTAYWSEGLREIYGVKPDFKPSFNSFISLIHPDDRERVTFEVDAITKAGITHEICFRIIRPDNEEVRSMRCVITTKKDKSGKIIRRFGIAQDITEKEKAELEITTVQNLLLESQRLGKMGNWNLDFITNVAFWSDGLKEIYGVDKDFVPSVEAALQIVHPEDRHILIKELNEPQEGDTHEIEFRIIRQDTKEVRNLLSIGRIVKDKSGKVIRRFGISRDVTEHKKSEEDLSKLNMQLYQVSHDLRGPLNSAKNYIYLALKKVKDETAIDYLQKIHDSYSKMEHRVLSLLDIQRVNRTEAHVEKINIPLLIKEIISSIDGIKGFKEVKIETTLGKIPENFKSDKQFLHSILHNLISNAIVYRRKDSKALIKVLANFEKNTLTIRVADNGPGIPEPMKNRIFQKFAKGESSINGTGLGLFIVKNLVDKLNGTIEFNSTAGIGTTFNITIPCFNEDEPVSIVPAA